MQLNFKRQSLSLWQIVLILSAILFISSAIGTTKVHSENNESAIATVVKKNKKASLNAWAEVYKVLSHQRCVNCHPAGDVPLQGEESRLHDMAPQRGPDGKGLYAMKCINCHGNQPVAGKNTPPGNPNWHMPPADFKMVFEGISSRQLALQIIDPEKNGNKSIDDLKAHADDTLVKAAWNMGGDRELPPLTYDEFKKQWIIWIENGAFAPDKE